MSKKKFPIVTATFDKIVGGGQALATLDDGRKLFAWNALPGETAEVQISKKKSSYAEGIATVITTASSDRIPPKDLASYLSTSPWQIMQFSAEQHYKAALIEEAFELHDIVLPNSIDVYSDGIEYEYRNKVEFSWYGQTDAISGADTLDLAFFRRGSKGKIIVDGTSLAQPIINRVALNLRDILSKKAISARALKTVIVRSTADGEAVFQLYVKDTTVSLDGTEFAATGAKGGEVIYSNPQSPASVITERLQAFGDVTLVDTILDVPFRYAAEGFFQVNVPVYEQALRDMKEWVLPNKPTVDLYSGVGSIGLTIGGPDTTLVEINEHAVREMKRNIAELQLDAAPVLAASEHALEYISSEKTIIIDPPRAGLHTDIIDRLLETKPERIIYLSCNPVTQARDIARLAEVYGIRHHRGYNFFPRTPHIEHLAILDRRATL